MDPTLDSALAAHVLQSHTYRRPGEEAGEPIHMDKQGDTVIAEAPEQVEAEATTVYVERTANRSGRRSRRPAPKLFTTDFVKKYIKFAKLKW